MKKNVIRIVLVMIILAWMFMVFGFSNADGEASSGLSIKVSEFLSIPLSKIVSIPKEEITISIEPVIRKLAHLSEYTVRRYVIFWNVFYV